MCVCVDYLRASTSDHGNFVLESRSHCFDTEVEGMKDNRDFVYLLVVRSFAAVERLMTIRTPAEPAGFVARTKLGPCCQCDSEPDVHGVL